MRDQDGLYFATSGIRGKSNLEISPELALRVGRAVANWLIDDKNSSHNVYVGFDNRRNSISIANVIIAALTSSGINVTTFSDPIPTPLLIFSILNSKSDAGIMVTGSHLPKDDNGIILFELYGPPWTLGLICAPVIPRQEFFISPCSLHLKPISLTILSALKC